FLTQLVENAGAPAGEQLADDLQRGLADAIDLGEGAALQGVAQVAGKARDGAGGVLEGADAERVVALERERRGDLLEDGANGRLVHGRGNVTSGCALRNHGGRASLTHERLQLHRPRAPSV